MIEDLLFAVTLVSALGCGLNAGVLFAFSSFVMRALQRLPPAQGIAAMQSINVVAVTRWFMSAFFGTAACCLLLAVLALTNWSEREAIFRLIGSALYLVGTILVTIAFNVPRNNALAAVPAESADAATRWVEYVRGWTAWNHVRTVAALAASAVLTLALVGRP